MPKVGLSGVRIPTPLSARLGRRRGALCLSPTCLCRTCLSCGRLHDRIVDLHALRRVNVECGSSGIGLPERADRRRRTGALDGIVSDEPLAAEALELPYWPTLFAARVPGPFPC